MNTKRYLILLLISMVPVVELRGAVPVGVAWGLPFWRVYAVSVLGNIAVIIPVIFFGERALAWGSTLPKVGVIAEKILARARKKAAGITGAVLLGLYVFVAVPLPGTGAWTGSLIAAILDISPRRAFFPIALGVATAGIIMGIVSYGALSLIG